MTAIQAQNPSPGYWNTVPYSIPENFIPETARVFVSAGMLNPPENTSHVQLYRVSGSLVLNRDGTTASVIDLTDLPKGFYVVRLTISGNTFAQKIVL